MVSPSGFTASSLFFTFSRKTYVTLAVHRSRLSSVWSEGLVKTFSNSMRAGIWRLPQIVKNDVLNLYVDKRERAVASV